MECSQFIRPKGEHEEEGAANRVLEYFNKFSICEKGTMLNAFDEKCGTHLAKAEAWLLGHELRNWATEQNVTDGIVPSSRHIRLQRRTDPGQGSTGADRSERSVRWKIRQSNQWVHRWAKRHKVTQGAFRDGV